MYQFVQNKLVLIHEQININITEHIKMIIILLQYIHENGSSLAMTK